MKLSVKWLAGLAVLVLAVVAVVGSTSATKAAVGNIYVVNEWSDITNESPAPTGRTFRSSVYATISDGVRLVETDADLVRVVVVDDDLNLTTVQNVTLSANITVPAPGGDGDDDIIAPFGNSAVIQLTGMSSGGTDVRVAGSLADVQANTVITAGGVDINANGSVSITNFFAGNGTADPWISVIVNVAGPYSITQIDYQTSGVNSVDVKVVSDLESDGITITAEETGLSTGIFEGFVRLVPNTASSADGAAPTLDGTIDPATAGTIRTSVGPVKASFNDGGTNRESSVLVDTSAPTNNVTGPVDGTATQNATPTFSGSISESGSGLDISSIQVVYDERHDPLNTTEVVTISAPSVSFPGVAGTDYTDLAPSTTGALDGDTAFSFSKTATRDLPFLLPGGQLPDNIIDWVIRSSDLAGNIGLSDADATTTPVELHTVKVDKQLPVVTTVGSDHVTGKATSASGEVDVRNSVRIVFNDKLTNVQASDFTVTLSSSEVIVPTKVTVQNDVSAITPALSATAQGAVYLEFANDLVSNDTPTVTLQDNISDLAGNFTSNASTVVSDGIAPSLTVTLSGGSGTGISLSSHEGPANLTKDEMVIEVVSDESLAGAPIITVYDKDALLQPSFPALAQGANKWSGKFTVSGSPVDGKHAIKVVATDTNANQETVGSDDVADADTPTFVVDTELAKPSLNVGGGSETTDQRRPSIVIDYLTEKTSPTRGGEASTVTLSKVQLDGTDITSDVVAASDGRRFFYIPPTDLSLGDHKLLIDAGDAADAADNEGAMEELTLTIDERAMFSLDVFAGWVAFSLPSDPVDPDPNSVVTNAGHDALLGFDPTVPGGWLVSVRDTVSGQLEPASEAGLTTIRSTQAYWLHSLNFEPVEVLLIGETLPGSGSPPAIVTIDTVPGFNAVPIVDTSRKLTTGNAGAKLVRQLDGGGTEDVTVSTYLGAVSEGRVYKWNPEILSYQLMKPTDIVRTGEVLFVEVTGTPVPIFP